MRPVVIAVLLVWALSAAHEYLTLARRLGQAAAVDAAVQAIVPRVFSEAGPSVSFPETGDPYETMRLSLARAIVAAQSRTR